VESVSTQRGKGPVRKREWARWARLKVERDGHRVREGREEVGPEREAWPVVEGREMAARLRLGFYYKRKIKRRV
jgi:hypothetical protein